MKYTDKYGQVLRNKKQYEEALRDNLIDVHIIPNYAKIETTWHGGVEYVINVKYVCGKEEYPRKATSYKEAVDMHRQLYGFIAGEIEAFNREVVGAA
jgi:hypothetical protein